VGIIVGIAAIEVRGTAIVAGAVGIGAKVSPIRLKGVKVIRGARGVVTRALAGTVAVTGTVGIKLVIPTLPMVATGTVGKTAVENRVDVVKGTLARR
jgi:hypothetical protein